MLGNIIRNINKFIITYYNKYYNKITIKYILPFRNLRAYIYPREYKGYLGCGEYLHILNILNILMFLLGQTLPHFEATPPSLPLASAVRSPITKLLNKDTISSLKNSNLLKYNKSPLNPYKKCVVLEKLKKNIKY